MSDFEAAGPMLFWRTYRDRVSSPVFIFQNSYWRLKVTIKRWFSSESCGSFLDLSLLQESPMIPSITSFEVTCLYKSLGDKVFKVETRECLPYVPDEGPWEAPILHINDIHLNCIKFILIFQNKNTELQVKTVIVDEPSKIITSDLDGLSADLCSLLESGQVSDVQLKTNGRILSAHRSVLAARSEVFSAMFRSDMKENTSGSVDISDVDGEVMDLFLQYVYTGKIPDSSHENSVLSKLYAAGDKYAVRSLKKLCSDLLTGQVSQDNYRQFLEMADAHSDVEFKDKVIKVVVENHEWLTSERWFDFCEQNPALTNYVYRKLYDKTYKGNSFRL